MSSKTSCPNKKSEEGRFSSTVCLMPLWLTTVWKEPDNFPSWPFSCGNFRSISMDLKNNHNMEMLRRKWWTKHDTEVFLRKTIKERMANKAVQGALSVSQEKCKQRSFCKWKRQILLQRKREGDELNKIEAEGTSQPLWAETGQTVVYIVHCSCHSSVENVSLLSSSSLFWRHIRVDWREKRSAVSQVQLTQATNS